MALYKCSNKRALTVVRLVRVARRRFHNPHTNLAVCWTFKTRGCRNFLLKLPMMLDYPGRLFGSISIRMTHVLEMDPCGDVRSQTANDLTPAAIPAVSAPSGT